MRRWWGLLLFAVATALLGAFNGLGRLDAGVADLLLGWSGRPAPADVVIVGIDDASLAALGRWPWPREVHARLLDRLGAGQPRAVGLDLMLSEPDVPGDAALAAAMRRQRRVVLPVRMAPLQSGAAMVSLPVPPLAAAAAALGHLHVELDDDGVARSIFLHEGFGQVPWEHFALAVLRAAGEPVPLPRVAAVDLAPGWWRREQRYLIPYAGPAGHVRRLSYVDVLEERVPLTSWQGAIVLVGATAPGLTDAYPTPVASQDALMPGVEITAQALAALREGRRLRAASPMEAALLTLAALALAVAALRFAPPRWALVVTLFLLPLTVAAAWALLRLGVQWRPLAAVLGLLLLYPLWSWQRLQAAIGYLAHEFERTREQLPPGGGAPPAAHGDLLERRMAALSTAAAQWRALQHQRQQALHFLSHDLRAPLSATLALIELQADAPTMSPLPAIEAQTRRALALAEGFVQLAKAESPEGYRLAVLDLCDIVVEAVDACWPAAQAAQVTLDSETPAHECLASADAAMLSRALVNLIDNALRHGSRRAGTVQCRLLTAAGGWCIEVLDAGAPLRPELGQGLFTRFQRGETSASGAGLGLAFVREVALHHGGQAGWRATAQGNCFFLELPTA